MMPDLRKIQRLVGATPDGVWGPESERLLNEAVARLAKPADKPVNLAAFFSSAREQFGSLSQGQVAGCEEILRACEGWPTSWKAYALATTWHETAATMQPIAEYGKGRGRAYGVPGRNHGQVAYGRGYVQLTWDDNYEKMDRELGLNGKLVADYDLAMRPDIAARILRVGMEKGLFTSKKMADYLDRSPPDYAGARRIINSLDKAELVAQYAKKFEMALR